LRRKHDHGQIGAGLTHTVKRLDPVAIGQHHIGDQRGKGLSTQQAVALDNRIATGDGKTLGLQRGGDDDGNGLIVLNQQYGHSSTSVSYSFGADLRRDLPPVPPDPPAEAMGRWRRKWGQPPPSSRSRRQPKPLPGLRAGGERFEDLVAHGSINALPVVGHPHLDREAHGLAPVGGMELQARNEAGAHNDPGLLDAMGGLARIGQEVDQHLNQPVRAAQHM
ncbi:hypothetical protein E4T56_gene17269, partial [Termitomyces sp. T112]